MNPNQSLNLNADFFNNYSAMFIKVVFLLITVYILIMIMNFLRDKFINKETDTKKDDISNLLIILNKLFYISGFGFIIGNIVQFLFSGLTDGRHNMPGMNFRGEWDYLVFGLIIVFMGIGFKHGNNILKKQRTE